MSTVQVPIEFSITLPWTPTNDTYVGIDLINHPDWPIQVSGDLDANSLPLLLLSDLEELLKFKDWILGVMVSYRVGPCCVAATSTNGIGTFTWRWIGWDMPSLQLIDFYHIPIYELDQAKLSERPYLIDVISEMPARAGKLGEVSIISTITVEQ